MIAVTDLIVPSHLKKQALLFDKFTHPLGESLLDTAIEGQEQYTAEVAWLFENGIIVDLSRKVSAGSDQLFQSLEPFLGNFDKDLFEADLIDISEKLKANPDHIEQLLGIPTGLREQGVNSVFDVLQHINHDALRQLLEGILTMLGDTLPNQVRRMAAELREQKKIDAYPLISELSQILKLSPAQLNAEANQYNDVVSIILKRFPSPDPSVSWEQIIDYRNDPDSRGKILALRSWMHEVSRSELTQQEIKDKLDWLIYNYEKHLQLHKMKYSAGALETVLTVGAKFMEDIVKFKWGDAAKALFTLKHQRIALLEAEMGSPGSEVAYIADVKKKFG